MSCWSSMGVCGGDFFLESSNQKRIFLDKVDHRLNLYVSVNGCNLLGRGWLAFRAEGFIFDKF